MVTIGLFVTIAAAAIGLFAAIYHGSQLRKLPTRTEAGYDDTVAARALAFQIIIAAGLALPFIAYGLFRLIDPGLFDTVLF